MRVRSGPQNVEFESRGRIVHGYLAMPGSGSGPGVIVIQEWWGLVDHIREVTDRFASEGFVALAPDLYGGATTHDADEARQMMTELPVEQAARDLSGSIDYLLGSQAVTSSTIGTVGFCMGGGFVLVLAAQEPKRISAAVPYYAVGAYDEVDLSPIRAPVLGHFASEDQSATPAKARKLRSLLESSSSLSVDIRIYEGVGHGFFNDHGARYAPELAESTWQDTVNFLREHVT